VSQCIVWVKMVHCGALKTWVLCLVLMRVMYHGCGSDGRCGNSLFFVSAEWDSLVLINGVWELHYTCPGR